MEVKLISQLGSVESIANLATICYGKERAKNPKKLFNNLIKLGHTSVLEHMVFTFKIEGVSRACLAQLTRHRHASYTVESQRYCNYYDGFSYVTPSHLEEYELEPYINFIDKAFSDYRKLLDMGVKPEDARMILPNAVETNLYMTINLRSLMNFFKLRLDKAAQWEIRELAKKMFNELDKELQEILKEHVC